jgi:hypothetical protein
MWLWCRDGDTKATFTPRRGEEAAVRDDPFAVLRLPVRRDLTDEDVRAAWRRIAAATHPDLAGGGDPERYSAAAAAYDTLRTSFGRGEALADIQADCEQRTTRARRARPARWAPRHGVHRGDGQKRVPLSWAAVPRGVSNAALVTGIVAVAVLAVAAVGWTPASVALLVGAATWLVSLHSRRP